MDKNQESAAGKDAVWQMVLAAEVRTGIVTIPVLRKLLFGVFVVTCTPENVP